MKLAEKVVVVTGASSGIGRQVALDLAKEGCKVGVLARRQDRIDAVRDEILGQNGTARSYAADVTKFVQFTAAVDFFEKEMGPIDIFVNNAGYGLHKTFMDLSMEELRGMMEVNYFGTVHGLKIIMPRMLERDSGHIVNVASIAGEVFRPYFSGYSATKAAVVGLTHIIAHELVGTNVKVSMINPGPVTTEFFDDPSWENSVMGPDAMVSTPEDVSKAVMGAIRKQRLVTYVPSWIGVVPPSMHLSGGLGRAIMRKMFDAKSPEGAHKDSASD